MQEILHVAKVSKKKQTGMLPEAFCVRVSTFLFSGNILWNHRHPEAPAGSKAATK